MAAKFIDLVGLTQYDGLIKNYIGEADAKAFKTAKFDENTRTLKLFKAVSPADDATADFEVEIPETDVSGLLEKLTGAVEGDVVVAKADGTVEDGGVKLADLATKTEVNSAISTAVANAEHLKRSIVTTLPEVASADAHTIYMVEITGGDGNQKYEEFMLINGAFEKIGDSAVDLTDYATKEYADQAEADAKAYTDEQLANITAIETSEIEALFATT